MKTEDPTEPLVRHPFNRRQTVHTGTLQSKGVFAEVSRDGHEKLGPQALGLGNVGIPIYGIRDFFSGKVLHLVVVPNARLAATIGHVYLDFLEVYGGMFLLQTEHCHIVLIYS